MLAALAMFAACFESYYPSNYSPLKIRLGKNRENLQAPASGVSLIEQDSIGHRITHTCFKLCERSKPIQYRTQRLGQSHIVLFSIACK